MIKLTVEIPAPVEVAWVYITETAHLRCWWNDGVQLDPVIGGTFSEPWTDAAGRPMVTSGKVLSLKKFQELRLSWSDEGCGWPVETEVTFELEETPRGTRLTLTHGGWQGFRENDRDHLVDMHRQGWSEHLRNLAAYALRDAA
jgi:uncharacterized protein YndB with AHSA1/START domain